MNGPYRRSEKESDMAPITDISVGNSHNSIFDSSASTGEGPVKSTPTNPKLICNLGNGKPLVVEHRFCRLNITLGKLAWTTAKTSPFSSGLQSGNCSFTNEIFFKLDQGGEYAKYQLTA